MRFWLLEMRTVDRTWYCFTVMSKGLEWGLLAKIKNILSYYDLSQSHDGIRGIAGMRISSLTVRALEKIQNFSQWDSKWLYDHNACWVL